MVATQICFLFTLKIGEEFQFDEHIFSDGLVQPPSRLIRWGYEWKGNCLHMFAFNDFMASMPLISEMLPFDSGSLEVTEPNNV